MDLKLWKNSFFEYSGMVAVIIILITYFSFTTERFFTLTNFQTISTQIPAAIIVAVGMTFVLIIGGIDLSVGSLLALCSSSFAIVLMKYNFPVPVAILASLITGLLAGMLNAIIITKWSIPSFIVTLAMLEAMRGLTYFMTDSQTLYIGSTAGIIRDTTFFGVSLAFIIAILTVIIGQLILSYTPFGRQIIAVGYKEDVAYLSGIKPKRIKFIVFTLCGGLVGLAAIFHTARLSASDPNIGLGFELEAIAAVVIGGTSLMGGRGSVIRSLFGVLVIAILGSGLAQAGSEEYLKRIITGMVIVLAVILDQYRNRNRSVDIK